MQHVERRAWHALVMCEIKLQISYWLNATLTTARPSLALAACGRPSRPCVEFLVILTNTTYRCHQEIIHSEVAQPEHCHLQSLTQNLIKFSHALWNIGIQDLWPYFVNFQWIINKKYASILQRCVSVCFYEKKFNSHTVSYNMWFEQLETPSLF
jgi:hypothetical protein